MNSIACFQHQCAKTGLLKMLDRRQGVGQAKLLHHRERQAIRQAPSLVHPRPEQSAAIRQIDKLEARRRELLYLCVSIRS